MVRDRQLVAIATIVVLVIVLAPLLAIWWCPLGHLGIGWKCLLTGLALVAVFIEIGCPVSVILAGRGLPDNARLVWYGNAFALSTIVLAGVYEGLSSPVIEPTATLQLWRGKLDAIVAAKEKLECDRKRLVGRMMALGIQSSHDIGKSPAHRQLADELLEIQSQLETLESQRAKYQAAVERIDSAQRRLERRALLGEVGISQEAFNQLSETTAELAALLTHESARSVAAEVERDSLFEKAFHEKPDERE